MGPEASSHSRHRSRRSMNELEYQIRRFHSFLWASGGCYSDFLIHNIDECCWMKDAWPIMADGDRRPALPRGNRSRPELRPSTRSSTPSRTARSCCWKAAPCPAAASASPATPRHQGLRPSSLQLSHTPGPTPAPPRGTTSTVTKRADVTWHLATAPARTSRNPYDLEWDDLIDAIRNDKPYNEVQRGAEASLVTAMGRMAAHTGQVITYDDILNHEHEFAPNVDKLTLSRCRPAAGRQGRQVSGAAAGHRQEQGVRTVQGVTRAFATTEPARSASKGAISLARASGWLRLRSRYCRCSRQRCASSRARRAASASVAPCASMRWVWPGVRCRQQASELDHVCAQPIHLTRRHAQFLQPPVNDGPVAVGRPAADTPSCSGDGIATIVRVGGGVESGAWPRMIGGRGGGACSRTGWWRGRLRGCRRNDDGARRRVGDGTGWELQRIRGAG